MSKARTKKSVSTKGTKKEGNLISPKPPSKKSSTKDKTPKFSNAHCTGAAGSNESQNQPLPPSSRTRSKKRECDTDPETPIPSKKRRVAKPTKCKPNTKKTEKKKIKGTKPTLPRTTETSNTLDAFRFNPAPGSKTINT